MNDLKLENKKLKTQMLELHNYQIDAQFAEYKLVELEDRCRNEISGLIG